MSDLVHRKGKWKLTQQAFDALLAVLAPDRRQAAECYERMRTKLIKFFAWERCPFPEDHADEAINRVAKRASEGEEILSLESYIYGVARMVLKEVAAELQRKNRVLEGFETLASANQTAEDPDEADSAAACLQSCLDQVSSEQRIFILQYYHGEKRARIETRRLLADSLQIPLNAVRNRALRLREKMEDCVLTCLERKKSA